MFKPFGTFYQISVSFLISGSTRVKWMEEEINELKDHFGDFLLWKTVPSRAKCARIQKSSCTALKRRAPALIIKKIRYMNHKIQLALLKGLSQLAHD